jgi:cytochrome c peroxidase
MHDGGLATLRDVVDFYDLGGHRNDGLDEEIRPLTLTTEEKAALVAFLRTLSGQLREGPASLAP